MKALSIAWKDLQILVKDRGSLVLLFLVPMVFIFIFSGALGALSQEPEDKLIPLPVVNLDPDGAAAQALIDNLNAAGGVEVILTEQAKAQAMLEADPREINRVLTIPADFTSGAEAGHLVTLRLVSHPEASETETEAVRLVIEGVAQDLALQTQLIASLERMAEMQAATPAEQQAFTKERIVAQARSQFEAAQTTPLVAVAKTMPGQLGEQEEPTPLSDVQVRVAGFAILFVFLTGQTTARSIYEEKKAGSFRRLLAAPMSKATILFGKTLPNFITALIQILVIFCFGIFVLPLLGLDRLSLGSDPLALILVSLLVALCSSALGILIAALARTEGQIGGLGSLVLWGMGIVGGSIVPLYLFDDPFISGIGRIVPIHWANEAYYSLMVRGQGLADVTAEILVLLGFTVAFLAIALWKFDFD